MNGAETLPQGARWGALRLPLLLVYWGLGTPGAAPQGAQVGQWPVGLGWQLAGPVGSRGRGVPAPLVAASWKEGSEGHWAWVPDPGGAWAGKGRENQNAPHLASPP